MNPLSPIAAINATGGAAGNPSHHGARPGPAYGLCVHTTGRGVPNQANRTKRDALEIAIGIYTRGPNAAHYVIGYTGTIAQIVPDDRIAWHVGGGAKKRALYLTGNWRDPRECAPAAVRAWDRQWPGRKSPQHLFPGESANAAYVGVELIPTAKGQGVPAAGGGLFTVGQYAALIALGADLAERHGWPADWSSTSRLVGHEDVGLLDRHVEEGGWDPGFLRDEPLFDFPRVRLALSPKT